MIHNKSIEECPKRNLPFPQAVACLAALDIERYYTDLVRMEKIFYSSDGESYVEQMPIENMPKIAPDFNEAKIIEALRSIQKGVSITPLL